MRKITRACALLLAGALLLGGCAASETPEEPPPSDAAVSPSAQPAPSETAARRALTDEEADRLSAAVSALREAPGWVVHTTLSGGEAPQEASYDVDPGAPSFRGTITTRPDGDADPQSLTILRVKRLTWVKAQAEYWEQNGYDAESAAAASGLFVPFEPAAGDRLADNYDPRKLIDHLAGLDLHDDAWADDEGGADVGDGMHVSLREDGTLVVRTEASGSTFDVSYTASSEQIRVDPPARGETFIAQ